ncbi:MAG: FliM/FliN family flagellar motor switch protein [Planctomycetota bacterium]
MSDLLSSEEIDTLLQLFREQGGEGGEVAGAIAVHAGHASPVDVEVVDLLAPNRIGHGELGFLDRLLGETSRSIGAELARQLARPLRGECHSIEAIRWATWRTEFKHPSLLFEIALDPLRAPACLEMPGAFVHQLVDMSLGGSGASTSARTNFTPAEIAVVAGVMHGVADRLALSLRSLTPMAARMIGHAADPALLHCAPMPDEFVLAAAIRITGPGLEQTLRLTLPHADLDPLLARDQDARRVSSAPGSGRLRPVLARTMEGTDLPISVELGRVRLTLRQLTRLGVGDVLRLDTPVGAEVDLRVGPTRKLRGVVGRDGRARAFRVSRIVTDAHDEPR